MSLEYVQPTAKPQIPHCRALGASSFPSIFHFDFLRFSTDFSAGLLCLQLSHEESNQLMQMYRTSQPTKPVTTEKKADQQKGSSVSLLDLATGSRYQRDHGTKEFIEDEDGTKWYRMKVARTIFAKNLPKDLTMDEAIEFFSRAGVIKKDPESREEAIKIYKDEATGVGTGEAKVTYFRPESVPLAHSLLHEAPIRPGYSAIIEEARYKVEPGMVLKGGRKRSKKNRSKRNVDSAAQLDENTEYHSEDDEHSIDALDSGDDDSTVGVLKEKANKQGEAKKSGETDTLSKAQPVVVPKRKRKKMYDQTEELGWEEKEQKHIVLKNMFRPSQAAGDIEFYNELREEVLDEAKKCGHVESIKVFEGNEDGVIAIKFTTGTAAEKCIALMHGRDFDHQKVIAEFYDGYTDYSVSEKDEDAKKRDDNWADWLGDDTA